MATVVLDTLTTLATEEERGALVSMTREALVHGLSNTDFSMLTEALDAAGVPATGSSPSGEDNLVLQRRIAKMLDKDKCMVTLEYGKVGEGNRNFVFSVAASLSQITTENDRSGSAISLAHTFPADDPDFPGERLVQGATVSVLQPQATITAVGLKAVAYPLYEAGKYLHHINLGRWCQGRTGWWLCTDAQFRLHDGDTNPNTWEFTYTWQLNKLGWQPQVVFIDQRTGQPPDRIVRGIGSKTVNWYPYVDFNTEFPTTG